LDIFKNLSRIKMLDINLIFHEQKFAPGNKLYDIGADPEVVFVVKEGKLVQETVFEIDEYFKIPVEKKQWHVRRKTKRYIYKIRELTRGSIFGHEELFQKSDRNCRVKALSLCTVYCMNRKEFLSDDFAAQREELRETFTPLTI
jgi:CRP-like cAMP-binding protein